MTKEWKYIGIVNGYHVWSEKKSSEATIIRKRLSCSEVDDLWSPSDNPPEEAEDYHLGFYYDCSTPGGCADAFLDFYWGTIIGIAILISLVVFVLERLSG